MKRLSLAIAVFTSAALLSGCIIVPPRHGHGHRGHHHYGSHQHGGGPVYVKPVPPRRW